MLRDRAAYLECLTKKIELCEVTYDPEGAEEVRAAAETREVFQKVVKQGHETCRKETLVLVKEYYAQPEVNTDGKKTNEIPPAIEEHLRRSEETAAARFKGYREALVARTIELQNLLPALPKVVLGHIRRGATATSEEALGEALDTFQKEYQAIKSTRSLETLKPGLGHPKGKARLDMLVDAEEKRFGAAKECVDRARKAVVAATSEANEAISRTLLHATSQLLAMFDTLLLKSDIDPEADTSPAETDGEEQNRRGLKRLMQKQHRDAAFEAREKKYDGADATRSRYPVRTWPGVTLKHLASEDPDLATETTDEVKCFDMLADRNMIRQRDESVAKVCEHFDGVMGRIRAEMDSVQKDEEEFHANFEKLAAELRKYQ